MPFIFHLLQALVAATTGGGGGAVQSITSTTAASTSALTSAIATMNLGKVGGGGGASVRRHESSYGLDCVTFKGVINFVAGFRPPLSCREHMLLDLPQVR